jgi:hypothetical protein
MWHLLDCAGQPPIDGLSHRVNEDSNVTSKPMSRSIYGLVVGKLADYGLCDEVMDYDMVSEGKKSAI